MISIVGGWILNVSYMTDGKNTSGATIENVTNLRNGNKVGHAVEVIDTEFSVTSRFNSLPSFVNFGS